VGLGGGRYKLQTVEIEMMMRPFIPDYVPVVSEPDPFLKVWPAEPSPDEYGLWKLGWGGNADPMSW
jgi:hypothetical protein